MGDWVSAAADPIARAWRERPGQHQSPRAAPVTPPYPIAEAEAVPTITLVTAAPAKTQAESIVATLVQVMRAQEDQELAAATLQKHDFSFEGHRFLAKVPEGGIYDGDTLRVVFRFPLNTIDGRGPLMQWRARMAGYDSPEMKPSLKLANRGAEITAAHAAKDALTTLVNANGDGLVWIECGPFDKYGRPLVTMYTRAGPSLAENGTNINAWMMANGHGVPYDGGTKKTFAETHHNA